MNCSRFQGADVQMSSVSTMRMTCTRRFNDFEHPHPEKLLQAVMQSVALGAGERVLDSPNNPISIAMTVDRLAENPVPEEDRQGPPNQADDNASLDSKMRKDLPDVGGEGGTTSGYPIPENDVQTCQDAMCSILAQSSRTGPLESGSSGIQAKTALGASVTAAHQLTSGQERSGPAPTSGAACMASIQHSGKPSQGRVTKLGAMLWQRRVAGARVVARHTTQHVAGIRFEGYGSSFSDYPHNYMTAAAAIGGSREEVDAFAAKLTKCLSSLRA
jgi:hypothetical protein